MRDIKLSLQCINNRFVLKSYRSLKYLEDSPNTDIILSRLRAANIDFRVNNNNAASIYPINSIQMEIQVVNEDFHTAQAIIEEVEQLQEGQNLAIDFKEADEEDIAFERSIYERDKKIEDANPPYLLFFLMFIIIILSYLFATFTPPK